MMPTTQAIPVRFLPAPSLRPFVSHYWLANSNIGRHYVALPDGSVDVVVQVLGSSMESWVYGTTTTREEIAWLPQAHYLGIRFHPGKSGYFIKASARELTDGSEVAKEILKFSFEEMLDDEMCDVLKANVSNSVLNCAYLREALRQRLIQSLDTLLIRHLAKCDPASRPIDEAIDFITASHGTLKVSEAAAIFGQSRRQFERTFLSSVGVSAKFFSKIVRFQRATALITSGSADSLAEVAACLNYTDQSHMNREFRQLAQVSPSQFLSAHVAFLQDRC